VVDHEDGSRRIARGVDTRKDQSYVLYMLDQSQLAATLLPVGELTKPRVRAIADRLGLATAAKPDSQDVCFITSSRGRSGFLRDRLALTPAKVVDRAGHHVGQVDAVELVTVGQRKGLGLRGGDEAPRYVVDVDVAGGIVTVGDVSSLLEPSTTLRDVTYSGDEIAGAVLAQCSAHGPALAATFDPSTSTVMWHEPHRCVAPGQSVVLYDGEEVLGGGLAVSRVGSRARVLR
jgi:tRNA-specific 2-thiouridylase